MKNHRIWGRALIAFSAMLATGAGVAAAASSPAVQNLPATKVSTSAATLNASINPNGSTTSYRFQYGPTPALGSATTTRSAGAGTRPVAVSAPVGGLQSGTTYYYDVVASGSGGVVTSRTLTFTTSGPPPAQAQTGGATVNSSSSVTLTGVVSPGGVPTQYHFAIGSAAGSYTLDTPTQTTAASKSPVPVSITVNGLAAGTTFHYALVASHGGVNSSTGSDATFETFPNPVPRPGITTRTSPRAERGGPFVFATTGRVINRTSTPDALACTGTAVVSFRYGTRLVGRLVAPLDGSCRFASAITFRHLPVRPHRGVEHLRVFVHFTGNGYLAPVFARAQTITLG